MLLNINNMKMESIKREKILISYNDVFLNQYKQLDEVSFFWNDQEAIIFREEIEVQKKEITKFLNELKAIDDIYNYIITSYEKYGNKIEIDLSSKNRILESFNRILNKIDSILSLYNKLDLSFCPQEADRIMKQKNEIFKYKEQIETIKHNIVEIFEYIISSEREISKKISKI